MSDKYAAGAALALQIFQSRQNQTVSTASLKKTLSPIRRDILSVKVKSPPKKKKQVPQSANTTKLPISPAFANAAFGSSTSRSTYHSTMTKTAITKPKINHKFPTQMESGKKTVEISRFQIKPDFLRKIGSRNSEISRKSSTCIQPWATSQTLQKTQIKQTFQEKKLEILSKPLKTTRESRKPTLLPKKKIKNIGGNTPKFRAIWADMNPSKDEELKEFIKFEKQLKPIKFVPTSEISMFESVDFTENLQEQQKFSFFESEKQAKNYQTYQNSHQSSSDEDEDLTFQTALDEQIAPEISIREEQQNENTLDLQNMDILQNTSHNSLQMLIDELQISSIERQENLNPQKCDQTLVYENYLLDYIKHIQQILSEYELIKEYIIIEQIKYMQIDLLPVQIQTFKPVIVVKFDPKLVRNLSISIQMQNDIIKFENDIKLLCLWPKGHHIEKQIGSTKSEIEVDLDLMSKTISEQEQNHEIDETQYLKMKQSEHAFLLKALFSEGQIRKFLNNNPELEDTELLETGWKGLQISVVRQFEDKISANYESLYQIKIEIKIKGAESLVNQLKSAVKQLIIQIYLENFKLTNHHLGEQKLTTGIQVLPFNCISYKEYPPGACTYKYQIWSEKHLKLVFQLKHKNNTQPNIEILCILPLKIAKEDLLSKLKNEGPQLVSPILKLQQVEHTKDNENRCNYCQEQLEIYKYKNVQKLNEMICQKCFEFETSKCKENIQIWYEIRQNQKFKAIYGDCNQQYELKR